MAQQSHKYVSEDERQRHPEKPKIAGMNGVDVTIIFVAASFLVNGSDILLLFDH